MDRKGFLGLTLLAPLAKLFNVPADTHHVTEAWTAYLDAAQQPVPYTNQWYKLYEGERITRVLYKDDDDARRCVAIQRAQGLEVTVTRDNGGFL